jgi:homoserine dehydrogenase
MVEGPTLLNKFRGAVEAYLEQTGMSPTRFGMLACRDQSFVFDLRDGREPRFSTIEKVEGFMREHPGGETEKPAACAAGSRL